ncbi:FecR family protein [Aurantiacibacter sp. MUD11]|uniref:FecR family protein n=1 Tax=Aurantiacibacter sp. MUD11 TaxID=3003265 RepID=UPI0022AAFFCD|nr:FecR family protein [Aurantiacibacter sp. MUD11]WAT18920.1 FecR family protein [Aurantiacibacter sp. MUD11]
MHKPNRILAALAATSILASNFAALPAAAQRTEVGNAAVVVGNVELSNDQQRRPRQVQRRDRIAWGDLIETENNSQLQILLLDRSSFGVGERSRVRIDEYVYDPDEGRNVIVSFLRGALRFFSGSDEGNNSAEVNSPAARIGIRGTAIDMLVGDNAEDIAEDEDFVGSVRSDDDDATLVILRGPGAQTAGGLTVGLAEVESAGVTVVLDEPGLAAYVPRAGVPPIGPFRISNSGLANIQEELAPEVARANSGGGFLEALIPIAIGAVALGVLLSGDGEDDTGATADYPNDNNTADRPPSGQDDNNQGPTID